MVDGRTVVEARPYSLNRVSFQQLSLQIVDLNR